MPNQYATKDFGLVQFLNNVTEFKRDIKVCFVNLQQ